MIIDKNVTRVTVGNTDIQKIMTGGGYSVAEVLQMESL